MQEEVNNHLQQQITENKNALQIPARHFELLCVTYDVVINI